MDKKMMKKAKDKFKKIEMADAKAGKETNPKGEAMAMKKMAMAKKKK